MNRIHKVLIPTDFSPSARAAFRYAQQLAADDDSFALLILHVPHRSPDRAEREAIRQRFNDLQQSLPSRLQKNSRCLLEEGPLVDVVLRVQQQYAADLIVMGTDGSSEEEDQADSRAARLVLAADCPVLVIPAHEQGFRMQHIAVALDQGTIEDETTLGVVHDFARWFGAKVHLLTIQPKHSPRSVVDAATEDTLAYYLETLDYHHIFPENTDIERGITEYIQTNEIDLLAILPRNHDQKAPPSEGRLTKLLTLRAPVPLLVVD